MKQTMKSSPAKEEYGDIFYKGEIEEIKYISDK